MKSGYLLVFPLLLLYLAEVPLASFVARLFVHFFLIGWLARKSLGLRESRNALFEAIALSIGITASALLLTGNLLEISSLFNRIIFAGIILALYLHNGFPKLEIPKKELKRISLLFLLPLVTLGGIMLLNPTYGLISDGWWHCSILNTIKTSALPPSNPWMANAELAYPYAIHAYIGYVAGDALFCLDALGLFSILTAFAFLLGVYGIAAESVGSGGGLWAALTYFFVSTVGGMLFLFDAAAKIASSGIGKFLAFLKDVHGPHQWYTSMKLLSLGAGVTLVFTQSAMFGAYALVFAVSSLYFALKGSRPGLVISFAPLLSTNPVIAIITGLALAGFLLWKDFKSGILTLALLGISTLAVNSSYAIAVLSKVGTYTTPLLGMNASAPGALAAFAIGFAPLLAIALLRGGKYGKTANALLLSLAAASAAAALLLNLGWLYFPLTLFLAVALCAGPWFADCMKRPAKLALVLLLSVSSLLTFASYAYYGVRLSPDEIAASTWLRDNTPRDAVILSYIDTGVERQTFMYSSAFGGRRNYIGDLTTLGVYGEDYSENLRLFNAVFLERNGGETCDLAQKGIGYLYVDNASISAALEAQSCIRKVYGNAGVSIFKTAP